MILYLLFIYTIIPIISFFAFIPKYTFDKKKAPVFIIILAALIIISSILSFRDISAPNDFPQYEMMYKSCKYFYNIFSAYHGNIFFSFLLYLGNILNLSSQSFFLLLSILYLTIYYHGLQLIFKKKKYVLMAIVFFSLSSTFVLLFTNVIRQGLSLSLIILAIGLYLKKHKFISYFIMLLAIFSHFSAIPIVFLIFLSSFLTKINLNHKTLLVGSIFCGILGVLFLNKLSILGGFFNKILTFSKKDYNNHLMVYTKITIMYLFSILLLIYNKKQAINNHYNYKFLVTLYILLLSLILFTLPVLLLSSRFLYYGSGIIPILLTYIFYSEKNLLKFKQKAIIFLMGTITYGYIVYNFSSIKNQLGI